MTFIEKPLCDRYGLPLPVDHGPELLSPLAISDPPVFRRARAVARYDGLARELVHRLEYGDRMELGFSIGSGHGESGARAAASRRISSSPCLCISSGCGHAASIKPLC